MRLHPRRGAVVLGQLRWPYISLIYLYCVVSSVFSTSKIPNYPKHIAYIKTTEFWRQLSSEIVEQNGVKSNLSLISGKSIMIALAACRRYYYASDDFYRATACNATHGLSIEILSVCPSSSVCLSNAWIVTNQIMVCQYINTIYDRLMFLVSLGHILRSWV